MVLLGVDNGLDEAVALTAGYRFQAIGLASGDITRSNGSSVEGENDAIFLHAVTAGLRFNFWPLLLMEIRQRPVRRAGLCFANGPRCGGYRRNGAAEGLPSG